MALCNSTDQPVSGKTLRQQLTKQCYPQYYRLLQFALTLPVRTATANVVLRDATHQKLAALHAGHPEYRIEPDCRTEPG